MPIINKELRNISKCSNAKYNNKISFVRVSLILLNFFHNNYNLLFCVVDKWNRFGFVDEFGDSHDSGLTTDDAIAISLSLIGNTSLYYLAFVLFLFIIHQHLFLIQIKVIIHHRFCCNEAINDGVVPALTDLLSSSHIRALEFVSHIFSFQKIYKNINQSNKNRIGRTAISQGEKEKLQKLSKVPIEDRKIPIFSTTKSAAKLRWKENCSFIFNIR